MKRRIMALLLGLTLVLASVAFSAVAEEDPYAAIRGKTLSYWYPMWQTEADFVGTGDMGDLEIYKKLEEVTGVNIEWIHPPVADNATAYNVLMASSDLPDIVTHEYYVYYPGGADKAISDGVYVNLKELLPEYAPNYWKLFEEDPVMLKDVTTDEGNIWCFYMIDTFAQPSYAGPIFRTDYLAQLGEETPVTMEDTYRVLKRFKDELGLDYPTNFFPAGYETNSNTYASAYGVKGDFFCDGETVKYGPIQDGWRDYLTEMNRWFEEGLIPRDFMTWDNTQLNATITSGEIGCIQGMHYLIGTWNQMLGVEAGTTFAAVGYPTLKAGDKVNFKLRTYRTQQNCTAVTTACEDPGVAVAWLDAKFTELFKDLGNYGVEGLTFEYVDGKPTYTDYAVNNPDGINMTDLMYKYGFGKGPYFRVMGRQWFTFPAEAVQAMYTWDGSSTGAGELPEPFLSMSAEEGEECNAIMADIKTYFQECCVKFITGEMKMDQWDAYVQTIRDMGVERATELKQASYQRYLTR